MKKNMLASMALGALLFVGCGDSLDDKKELQARDYRNNVELAFSKTKWCLSKVKNPPSDLKDFISWFGSKEEYRSIYYNKFDSINENNCIKAGHALSDIINMAKILPDDDSYKDRKEKLMKLLTK